MRLGAALVAIFIILFFASQASAPCTFIWPQFPDNSFAPDKRFYCWNSTLYAFGWPYTNPAVVSVAPCQQVGNYFASHSAEVAIVEGPGGASVGGGIPFWNPLPASGNGNDYFCTTTPYTSKFETQKCQNQQCVACAADFSNCKTGATADKKVLAYYFYWYDYASAATCPCTNCSDPANPCYAFRGSTDQMMYHPISGMNTFMNWNNVAFHKANLASMKRAGIDAAILIYWPHASWGKAGLAAINSALRELDAQGIEPPKIGLFFDTSDMIWNNLPEPEKIYNKSLAEQENLLVADFADFYNAIDDEYEFLKDGRRYIQFYLNVLRERQLPLTAEKTYSTKEYCPMFGRLKSRTNAFLVMDDGWGYCNEFDAYSNFGSGYNDGKPSLIGVFVTNSATPKLDICEVSPGYEKQKWQCCVGLPLHPLFPREGDFTYDESWKYCIETTPPSGTTRTRYNRSEGWIVIQTWNEFWEGTNIAPTLPTEFGNANVQRTRDWVQQFKGTAPAWKECLIDEECYINGEQKLCVNNTCQAANSQCGLNRFPATIIAGETKKVLIDVDNLVLTTGWSSTASPAFALSAANSTIATIWGTSTITLVCTNANPDTCLLPTTTLLPLEPTNHISGAGSWYRFVFDITAPAIPETYTNTSTTKPAPAFQMAHGTTKFGATCGPAQIQVVAAPTENCANNIDDDADTLIDCADVQDCRNGVQCCPTGTNCSTPKGKCNLAQACIPAPTMACPDAKTNGVIDIFDLATIVQQMNATTKDYFFDITNDSQINSQDLLATAQKIGTNCTI